MRSDLDFPAFAVACGEEGSDPLVLHEGQTIRVDQYRASSHLEHLDPDLADVASLGVSVWRYGMPWRETETAPGVFDWTLWDRALEACQRHGLEPVIDLCHFGLPDHYGGFCDTGWVDGASRDDQVSPGEPAPSQTVRLRPLPACAEPSFPVLHDYFEVVYGPLIGPASLLLERALARHLVEEGGPVTVPATDLAREVGLRSSHDEPIGRSSHLGKALQRLAHHRLIRWEGTDELGVALAVAPIADRRVPTLPPSDRRSLEHAPEHRLRSLPWY